MAISSSSLAAGRTFSIWLHTTGGLRVSKVDVPWPLPALLLFGGKYYVYSETIYSGYVEAVPFVPTADLGAAALSTLAFPQF